MSSNTQLADKASLSRALLVTTTLLLGSGCASTEEQAEPVSTASAAPVVNPNPEKIKRDPYENFNRSMYDFNMSVDRVVLKPVASGYKAVTPDFVQSGVSNFFNNLKGINVVINDLLQGKFEQGASDAGRFTTNSTLGVLGLFDVASDFGMSNNVEDFGQTLAVWGVEQGPYLVLPLFGPTTVRDGSAVVFDKAANPGTYVPGSGIVEGISDRANAQGALNFIDEAALDPYVFMRESFLQYRASLVKDGKVDASSYDLDIDAALDEAEGNASSTAASSSSAVSAADAKKKQSFDQMSQSFTEAEKQFATASAKLDKIEQQRRKRRKR